MKIQPRREAAPTSSAATFQAASARGRGRKRQMTTPEARKPSAADTSPYEPSTRLDMEAVCWKCSSMYLGMNAQLPVSPNM